MSSSCSLSSSEASKVLTRAARKKAGLSPPPSLYDVVPRSAPTTPPTPNTDRHPSSSSNPGSEASSDEELGATQLWVQCDTAECKKWRLLPKSSKIDTESAWYCNMHPDPAFQSCDVPEQKWRRERFVPGQLVWAKMNSFPPWPAIITPDPWSDNNHMCKDMGGCIYHVEFLGKVRTHLWLVDDKVEAYCSNSCSLGCVNISTPSFTASVTEAETLKSWTNSERLSTCTYISLELKKKTPRKTIPQPKERPPVKRKIRQKKSVAEEANIMNSATAAAAACGLTTSQKLLQKFIQTHFKLDIDGVLKLATAPESINLPVKQQPKRPRRTKAKPFPCNPDFTKNTNMDTSATATQQDEIQSHKSHRPRIFPTISDYLNRPANASEHLNKVPSTDQMVPESGSCFSSAEDQARREMEEIEGLLSMFDDSKTSRVTEHVTCACTGSSDDPMGGGLNASGSGVKTSSTVSSEWIESVLGEIDQIEGMIQDLSKGQVVPCTK